jgi:hypothetical protein
MEVDMELLILVRHPCLAATVAVEVEVLVLETEHHPAALPHRPAKEA